jgi:hypothetical protein
MGRLQRDTSSKGRIVQGTHCPRDALSKERIVQETHRLRTFDRGDIDRGHIDQGRIDLGHIVMASYKHVNDTFKKSKSRVKMCQNI